MEICVYSNVSNRVVVGTESGDVWRVRHLNRAGRVCVCVRAGPKVKGIVQVWTEWN